MPYLKITPKDNLFFRSAAPFTMSETSWVNSALLPNPSVIWGAMFSHLVTEQGIDKSQTGRLKIGRVLLHNDEQHITLFPAPKDLFADADYVYTETYVKAQEHSSTPVAVPWLTVPDTNNMAEPPEDAFIDDYSLLPYIRKINEDIAVYHAEDLAVADYKVGIKRDKATHTAAKSHLYRTDLTQFFRHWHLLVEYQLSGYEFPQSGTIRLGGETRLADYEQTGYSHPLEDKDVPGGDKLKVLFTAPAFLNVPYFGTDKPHAPELPDGYTLQAASIGKLLPIGGWDMKAGRPKPLKKAVPPGSVLVLENSSNTKSMGQIKNELLDKLVDTSATKLGFNQMEIIPLKY